MLKKLLTGVVVASGVAGAVAVARPDAYRTVQVLWERNAPELPSASLETQIAAARLELRDAARDVTIAKARLAEERVALRGAVEQAEKTREEVAAKKSALSGLAASIVSKLGSQEVAESRQKFAKEYTGLRPLEQKLARQEELVKAREERARLAESQYQELTAEVERAGRELDQLEATVATIRAAEAGGVRADGRVGQALGRIGDLRTKVSEKKEVLVIDGKLPDPSAATVTAAEVDAALAQFAQKPTK